MGGIDHLVEDLRAAPVEALAARLARLADDRGARVLAGVTGPPGAGKSTLADALAAALGSRAAVVGMDGFHLAQAELTRLGRAARKGAADTFDAAGYVVLLRRLRAPGDEIVYAPRFDRALEEPVGSALRVAPAHDVIVTEGNYLLLWDAVRPLLDVCWYVELDEAERRRRLRDRHVAHGRTLAAADAWMAGTDDPNAAVVAATRDRADALVRAP